MAIKLICREIECVEGVVRRILEENGYSLDNVKINVSDMPYNEIVRFDGSNIYINSVKFRSFATEVGGDSKLVSAYLIIVSLYAVINDKQRVRELVKKVFGDGSLESTIFNLLFS
ncbi:hypothetical protein [Stygiolobus azoricus]|uniref:Uncharacterized protein n=1 Tax=Stygiolobus azoricus TaxID=41675 RepID=A0A650CR32_9CREN|nr:hypothetical protein [Stygiolobus azoricus]QGR20248.1 hypothetical protein D1868_09785 [Stygiolobus azoricus]